MFVFMIETGHHSHDHILAMSCQTEQLSEVPFQHPTCLYDDDVWTRCRLVSHCRDVYDGEFSESDFIGPVTIPDTVRHIGQR